MYTVLQNEHILEVGTAKSNLKTLRI